MIFACDRCGRRYSVPDERIQGRPFRVTCKACGHVIQVRPAGKADPAAAPVARQPAPAPKAAATAREASPAIATARPAAAAAPPAAPAPAQPRATPVPSIARPALRVPVTANGLSSAEMAWLSGSEPRSAAPVEEPAAPTPPAVEEPVAAAPSGPGPGPAGGADGGAVPKVGRPVFLGEGPSSGSGFLRVLFLAALAAIALFAIGSLLWPGWRSRFAGSPPVPAEVREAEPGPAPAAAQPSAPAPAGAPSSAPAPVQAPASTGQASKPVSGGLAASPRPRARSPQLTAFESVEDADPAAKVPTSAPRVREAPHLASSEQRLLDIISQKRDAGAAPRVEERPDLDGSLDSGAVERVMGESQGAFSACVSRSVKAGEPGGDVRRATLRLTVDGDGSVAAAGIAEPKVGQSVLGRCLVAAARRLAFPSFPGARVDVAVPLVLQAR